MRFDQSLVEVGIPGECSCSTPHPGGDLVYMLPKLGYEAGLEAEQAFRAHIARVATAAQSGQPQPDNTVLEKELALLYVRHGAVGWNVVNGTGQPVPFDVEKLLADYSVARPIGEKGDELYTADILDPLARAVASFSNTGPTAKPTSPKNTGSGKRRKR